VRTDSEFWTHRIAFAEDDSLACNDCSELILASTRAPEGAGSLLLFTAYGMVLVMSDGTRETWTRGETK